MRVARAEMSGKRTLTCSCSLPGDTNLSQSEAENAGV